MDWASQFTEHFLSLGMLDDAVANAVKQDDGKYKVVLGKHEILFSKRLFDRLKLSNDTSDKTKLCLIKFNSWIKDEKERRILEFVYPDDYKIVTFDLTDWGE